MDLEVIFYHLTNCDRGFTALFMNKKIFPLKIYYRDINMSFFDVFNSIHNPDYYYGKQEKTQKKETQKKKKTRGTHSTKRHPIFKVSD